jgi:hypothetical protein
VGDIGRRIMVNLGKKASDPIWKLIKQKKIKKARGMAQLVVPLPSN